MRGAKLLRSGEISPGVAVACTGTIAASMGVSCAVTPLGTINAPVERSKVPNSLFRSLIVVKSFVAQPQIQREFRSDPPVVLSVKGIDLMVIVDIVQVIDAAAIAQTNQKRGKPGATAELAPPDCR